VEKRKLIPYIQFSSITVLVSFAYHVGMHYLFPSKEAEPYSTVPFLIFGISINTLFFLGLSLLVAYLTNLRDEQKQRKVLEAQKLQLEIEKSQANFNFFKGPDQPAFFT
jgi:hypothetical protein